MAKTFFAISKTNRYYCTRIGSHRLLLIFSMVVGSRNDRHGLYREHFVSHWQPSWRYWLVVDRRRYVLAYRVFVAAFQIYTASKPLHYQLRIYLLVPNGFNTGIPKATNVSQHLFTPVSRFQSSVALGHISGLPGECMHGALGPVWLCRNSQIKVMSVIRRSIMKQNVSAL